MPDDKGLKRPRNLDEAIETARKLPTYARLIWDLARDPRVPTQQKVVLGGIAAYLAFPIDLIPDFIPVTKHDDTLSKDLGAAGTMLEGRAKELRATLDKILSRQREGGEE